MEVDDLLDIGQAETKALHVVDITGVDSIELVEDFLHVLLLDTQTGVTDAEEETFFLVPGTDIEVERLIGFTVFHRVIHQIGDGVLEMHLIDIDGRINGLNLGKDLTTGMLYTNSC